MGCLVNMGGDVGVSDKRLEDLSHPFEGLSYGLIFILIHGIPRDVLNEVFPHLLNGICVLTIKNGVQLLIQGDARME